VQLPRLAGTSPRSIRAYFRARLRVDRQGLRGTSRRDCELEAWLTPATMATLSELASAAGNSTPRHEAGRRVWRVSRAETVLDLIYCHWLRPSGRETRARLLARDRLVLKHGEKLFQCVDPEFTSALAGILDHSRRRIEAHRDGPGRKIEPATRLAMALEVFLSADEPGWGNPVLPTDARRRLICRALKVVGESMDKDLLRDRIKDFRRRRARAALIEDSR
jgi:hypothetical protein